MLISATWGLGSTIAQGEVTPDRYELTRDGRLVEIHPGHKDHQVGCVLREEPAPQVIRGERVTQPCLDAAQAEELGRMLRRIEDVMGYPVEIEWARDASGFRLLQARPLHMQEADVTDEVWAQHPRLKGHPAGVGWATGRACVVNCECEISRVAPGDILVTKVAGPALSHILTKVAGVVTERGGSTSHMASLSRERGIPMVLGVLDATLRIPDGAQVAVDGVAGAVRWIPPVGRDTQAQPYRPVEHKHGTATARPH
jgi:pyruvate,water dikinase